jgi:hypothetical protein
MIDNGHLAKSDDIAAATKALTWLAENCFTAPEYVTVDGKPILLVFGPQYFAKTELRKIASGLAVRPMLFGLPHLSQTTGMEGAFGWPPVTGGREIVPDSWKMYLSELYARDAFMSVAFAAFKDIYREAELHDSYGFLDGRNGLTFTETLAMAKSSRSSIIQIATWNDYGEGTMIEPTTKNGFRYLEELQKSFAKRESFSSDELRLPIRLYQLQKRVKADSTDATELRKASNLLFDGKCNEALLLIDTLERVYSEGK